MIKRESGIAGMCGETYGVCEQMEDAKVSEREKVSVQLHYFFWICG